MKIREKLRQQITETSRPISTFNHNPYSMTKSNSIPFIPVTVMPPIPGQAKMYDLKPPSSAVPLYRTPSQSARYPKFAMVNKA